MARNPIHYSIAPEVFARYPGFMRGVIIAANLNNADEHPEVAALLAQRLEKARTDLPDNFRELPQLAVWDAAFRSMGINPNKFPPSVCNLVKRARSGKPLPYVSTLVAAFNCMSLKYLCPCGGDDLDAVRGNLLLAAATGKERYVPLGRPEEEETPPAGEIIYLDDATGDVFCRAWCWKNGDRSKLLPTTRRAAINIDIMPPYGKAEAEAAGAELAALLERCAGAATSFRTLDSEHPSFVIEGE